MKVQLKLDKDEARAESHGVDRVGSMKQTNKQTCVSFALEKRIGAAKSSALQSRHCLQTVVGFSATYTMSSRIVISSSFAWHGLIPAFVWKRTVAMMG
jgi:hypothetical protein